MFKKFDISDDLNDELDDLANLLAEFTKATGVYIGQLLPPKKKIGEDDDDKAHIDEENPKVVLFTNASKDHQFMVDKVLKNTEGITHDIFKDLEPLPVAEDEDPSS